MARSRSFISMRADSASISFCHSDGFNFFARIAADVSSMRTGPVSFGPMLSPLSSASRSIQRLTPSTANPGTSSHSNPDLLNDLDKRSGRRHAGMHYDRKQFGQYSYAPTQIFPVVSEHSHATWLLLATMWGNAR